MNSSKALVGLAIPLLTTLLVGFSSGEFNYEEVGMLAGSFITGLLVYLVKNEPSKSQDENERTL